ncbi:MAG: tetratricopeptide repeat protein [Cyanobacteria bacterium SZAS LIN-3]|nr:tetratricopeptide repeat protein [Cyanobacteria bacterium SZAS LIN-3]
MTSTDAVEAYEQALAILSTTNVEKPWLEENRLKLEQALMLLDRAISLAPDFADAYYRRGLTDRKLFRTCRRNQLNDFNRAIALRADFAVAYEARANWLASECAHTQPMKMVCGHSKAIEDLSRAIELDGSASQYLSRGMAYCSQGEFLKGILDYSKTIDLDPHSWNAVSERCFAFLKLGDFSKCLADALILIELDPLDETGYVRAGQSLTELQQYEEAIKIYTAAIDSRPSKSSQSTLMFYRFRAKMHRLLGNEALASQDEALGQSK